ncbi:MAG: hypothetical protein F4Y37_11075 [Caldilineaceae bacterium SB0664_bin_22]|nr:hypothetical protein [Caldilineaceae bacterium SB0664_bin_22]
MNRHSKLPSRFLLVLLSTILIAAGMTSISLAARTDWTHYYGGYFAVIEADSDYAWFSIDESCDDIDENCAVKVEGTPGGSGNDYTERWVDELSSSGNSTCRFSAHDYGKDQMYADFENCWEQQKSGFTVLWPIIEPDEAFEITPYCKRGDDVCAVELRICFNAADCENNRFRRRDWSQVGELWDEFGGVWTRWCIYEDDEDELWECIDEEFEDWRSDYLDDRYDDYDDLEDVEEEERGFTLEGYENNLNDVGGDRPSARRSETVHERSQQQGASRTSTSTYQPVRDAYLTVNFTAYLETNAPYQICNTTIGCITVATLSNTFRSYMQNLHIVIQDPGVLNCMGRVGWDAGNNHVIAFDNANLIACDARIRTANQVCPAKDTGASGDLLTMWDTGLLRGILFDTDAQAHRLQVERARDRTPECLCTAGFLESDFVVTANDTAGPWERSSAQRTENVCN